MICVPRLLLIIWLSMTSTLCLMLKARVDDGWMKGRGNECRTIILGWNHDMGGDELLVGGQCSPSPFLVFGMLKHSWSADVTCCLNTVKPKHMSRWFPGDMCRLFLTHWPAGILKGRKALADMRTYKDRNPAAATGGRQRPDHWSQHMLTVLPVIPLAYEDQMMLCVPLSFQKSSHASSVAADQISLKRFSVDFLRETSHLQRRKEEVRSVGSEQNTAWPLSVHGTEHKRQLSLLSVLLLFTEGCTQERKTLRYWTQAQSISRRVQWKSVSLCY